MKQKRTVRYLHPWPTLQDDFIISTCQALRAVLAPSAPPRIVFFRFVFFRFWNRVSNPYHAESNPREGQYKQPPKRMYRFGCKMDQGNIKRQTWKENHCIAIKLPLIFCRKSGFVIFPEQMDSAIISKKIGFVLANAAKNTVNQFQKHHSQKSQENAVCTLSL